MLSLTSNHNLSGDGAPLMSGETLGSITVTWNPSKVTSKLSNQRSTQLCLESTLKTVLRATERLLGRPSSLMDTIL